MRNTGSLCAGFVGNHEGQWRLQPPRIPAAQRAEFKPAYPAKRARKAAGAVGRKAAKRFRRQYKAEIGLES